MRFSQQSLSTTSFQPISSVLFSRQSPSHAISLDLPVTLSFLDAILSVLLSIDTQPLTITQNSQAENKYRKFLLPLIRSSLTRIAHMTLEGQAAKITAVYEQNTHMIQFDSLTSFKV